MPHETALIAIIAMGLVTAFVGGFIATKLRRGESFTVSWQHLPDEPRGRSTIWLHPSIPLRFVFDDPEPAELSRSWIEDLAQSANSSGGITLVSEHIDPDGVEDESPQAVEVAD